MMEMLKIKEVAVAIYRMLIEAQNKHLSQLVSFLRDLSLKYWTRHLIISMEMKARHGFPIQSRSWYNDLGWRSLSRTL